MQNPKGVTILAILAAIGGGVGLFTSIELLANSGGTIFWALVMMVLSSISLVFAFGTWYLKPWAWYLGIGVEGLTVLVVLISWIGGSGGSLIFLVQAIISGAILYSLFTSGIKRAFGRA